MEYRRLGNTELRVSVIGLGTWQFGGEWGEDFSQQKVHGIFDAARGVEINLIDTAECYGDHLSERLIGEAIRQDRDRWIVATKFGHRFNGFLERDQDFTPDGVRQQLEDSLRALQIDCIDVYQFHSGNNERFDNDALWTMLDKERQAGKFRFLGLSISASDEQIQQYQTERASHVGASVIQLVYNRLQRRPEELLFPLCRKQDLGVMARVPIASGLLSGKYQPGNRFPKNDVRATRDREKVDAMLREAARIQQEEVPAGVPMASWALAWCLNDAVVSSVIPGCKNADQVRQNAAAVELLSR